jgi:IclR family transcriptional regulator, KDG regulon repressor
MPASPRSSRTGPDVASAESQADGSASVKSARRVLDILELLSANTDGLKFPQIADLLGVPKSSLHALLATLHARKWIGFDETSRTYRIGMRAWEAGQGYIKARDLALIADEHLHAARTELNETIQLGVLEGVEVLYIAKVDADRPFRLISRAGMRLPAWATGLGKVLLAFLPADELRRRMEGVDFEPFTKTTITSLPQLERILEQIRADGIGRDEGEHTPFVFCVAAPVRDVSGTVVAAMSCCLPEPPERRPAGYPHIADVMARHAANLSKSLGFEGNGEDGAR